MVVLVAWSVAVFVALLVGAALALGLRGHVARLTRAAVSAGSDLAPTLHTLRSASLPARPRRASPRGMDDQLKG